eukprot:TRINITY_DN6918_c0_g2_i1.p1 TRINITY_DN6918_c0_g2~~TRINITY_DN6918_c0_g2_i1.p1  ORF type:complete len:494 (-),score=117.72 TRINITY_DN6918_c0_g2_i1:242-1723(-)
METRISSIVLQAFFVLHVSLFLSVSVLFYAWRNRFPISKRTPSVVLLQIILVGFVGAFSLAVPAFLPNSSFSCFWFNYIYSISFYSVVLVVLARILFLWNMSFHMRLVNEFHQLTQSAIQAKQKRSLGFRVKYLIYQRRHLLLKVPLFLAGAIVELLEVGIQVALLLPKIDPMVFDLIRGTPECRALAVRFIMMSIHRLIVIGILATVGLVHVLRVKENFGLVREVKAVLVITLCCVAYMIVCYTYPQVVGTTAHFIILGFAFEALWLMITVVPVLIWAWKFGYTRKGNQDSMFELKSMSSVSPPEENPNISPQASSITSVQTSTDKILLRRVLQDEQGHLLFHRFLSCEFALENLLFWDSIELLKKRSAESPRAEWIKSSEEVLTKFIEPSGVLCVNISAHTRKEILESFERSSNYPENQDYASQFLRWMVKAQNEVCQVMLMDTFLRFRQSPEFADLKLINFDSSQFTDEVTPKSSASEFVFTNLKGNGIV